MILTHGANSLNRGGGYVPTDEYDIVSGVYVSGSGQYGGGYPNTACSIVNPAKITIKTNATNYVTLSSAWSMFGLSTYNGWYDNLLTAICYNSYNDINVNQVQWRFGGSSQSTVYAIEPFANLNGEHTHILDGILGKLTIDDNLIANVTKSDQTYSYIFPAGKYWGSPSCLGVKECTIEDSSGNILCEYTSVRRKSDSALGFYSPQFGFFTSSSFAAVS